jgi:hypothetical protein
MRAASHIHPEPPLPIARIDDLQGVDPDDDESLIRECLAEAALRRHLQRIHDSHYASESPQPRALFRVG